MALHDTLPEEARGGVLRWFYVGGVGFVITILGCGVLCMAMVLLFLRQQP